MLFTSPTFLFLFLPCTLCFYFLLHSFRTSVSNFFLLAMSLLFYAWGEKLYLLLLLFSVLINHFAGLKIQNGKTAQARRNWLTVGVVSNLLALGFFKYTLLLVAVINDVFGTGLRPLPVTLPLGISFFTFQAISYLVDVYRKDATARRNLFNTGLYIALFPQLIAGPIVRYASIVDQLDERRISISDFDRGISRFVLGLAKKVLLANSFATLADLGFAADPASLSMLSAWVAVAAYTLQIYFDFSGYSDMAIGIGLMLGFSFPENFNYPYVATSVQEFWRRWHMSLSSWFRDYLYLPLGGNRKGELRTYFNLWIVFFLCGLWHGAQYTFLVWGIYHGFFLVAERLGLLKIINFLPAVLRCSYCLLVVMIGWVFFRADSISHALSLLSIMAGQQSANYVSPALAPLLSKESLMLFLIGIPAACPLLPAFENRAAQRKEAGWPTALAFHLNRTLSIAVISGLLFLIFGAIASQNYDPFIYFRF